MAEAQNPNEWQSPRPDEKSEPQHGDDRSDQGRRQSNVPGEWPGEASDRPRRGDRYGSGGDRPIEDEQRDRQDQHSGRDGGK
jgi:hypothetical protein